MTKHGHMNKTKKPGRKQTRLKTLGSEHNDVVVVPTESSVKHDRIKSAIENGTQSILPSDPTKGHYLTKFEHKGKEGPLVVYAEDKKMFNEFGHFTVITSFKPSDSLRNQLFFASPTASSKASSTSSQRPAQTTKGFRDQTLKADIKTTSFAVHQKNNGDRARHKHRQPNSFDGLVTRYKKRQEKYGRLLGDDSLYLLQKIEHLCKAKSKENNLKSGKKPQKERKQDVRVLPVLPKITVDKTSDKSISGKTKRSSSKQKQESKLPYLTVSRYSKL